MAAVVRFTGEGDPMKPLKAYGLAALVVLLGMAAGCARQTGIPGDESASSEDPIKLPFDRNAQSAGISPSHSLFPRVTQLPAGTPVTIRLQSTVSSASSQAGDSFEGALDEPIVVEGQTVAPRGAAVTGRVLAAKTSGRLHDPGYLRIALVSLKVAGQPVALQTSSIFAKGGAHENRNLTMIGGGAGAGALVGGLAGGGRGALIGTGVGAAGGTGAAYATGKQEVSFGEERRLTFRLAQAVDLR
jgi:hypothetical protein